MKGSEVKKSAREALSGKWGKGACILLAYYAFSIVLSIITSIFSGNEVMAALLELASAIIVVPISFGLTYAFIKLKRNEEVGAFDFISLGFSNFGRSWKIGLSTLVKLLLPLVAIFAVGFGLGICAGVATYAGLGESVLALIGLAMFAGFIITWIWYIARCLLYSLTTFVAFDNPNMSSFDVVNESARLMKGNRCKYFLIGLSFIGWVILAILTLGIGLLWVTPYMQVALVCFYEKLIGKKEENNVESNVDAITEM